MAKAKILIVDDDEAIRNSMKEALVLEGYEVVLAQDGAEGLAAMLNQHPDLIVADVEMPRLDGMSMLKEIRKAGEYGKRIPVIILTNYDTNEKTIQGIVDDEPSYYLIKSRVNPAVIIEKVKEKLGPVS